MIPHKNTHKTHIIHLLILIMVSISLVPLASGLTQSRDVPDLDGPKSFDDLDFSGLESQGYRPRFAYPGAEFIQAPEPIPEDAVHYPVGTISTTYSSPTRATWDKYYEDSILTVYIDIDSGSGGDLSSNEEQMLDRIISDFVNYSFPRVKDHYDPLDRVSEAVFYIHPIDGYSGTGGYYQPGTDEFHVDRADLSWAGPITAHEFEHYVHRQYDLYENLWIDEGSADYAAYLVYGISSVTATHARAYLDYNKDYGLVVTDNTFYNDRTTAYYGVAYLFQLYLTHQYGGKNWTRALVRQNTRGISGMNVALSTLSTGKDFDDVFTEWLVATRLNDGNLGSGEFEYGEKTYPGGYLNMDLTRSHSGTPINTNIDVNGYSNTIIRFSSPQGGFDEHRLKINANSGKVFAGIFKERSGNTQVEILKSTSGSIQYDLTGWGSSYNSFQVMMSSSSYSTISYSVDVLDLDPPVSTLTVSPKLPDGESGWYVTSPRITIQSSETSGSSYYRINGGEIVEYGSPFYLVDGEHNISYWSKDRHDNMEEKSFINVKVDTVSPTSSIDVEPALPEDSWYSSPPGITLTTTHPYSVVMYRFNNGEFVEYTGEFSPPEGKSVLYWKAVDQAGNEEQPNSRTLRVDTLPPHLEYTIYPSEPNGENGWYVSNPVLTLNSMDSEMIYYAFGNQELKVYTDPIKIPEGETEVRFICVDRAGNQGNETRLEFKVDSMEPDISGEFQSFTYSAQNSSLWLDFPPFLEITPSEDEMIINYTINGGEPIIYDTVFEVPEGENEIWIHAKDKAGNQASPLFYLVKVDKRDPLVEHSYSEDSVKGWFKTRDASIILSPVGENNRSSTVKVYYRWGADDQSIYKSPLNIPEGKNTITYWAEDLAGNQMEPRMVDIKKDHTDPMIYLTTDGVKNGRVDEGSTFTVDISGSSDESGIVAYGFDFDGSGPSWKAENVVDHAYDQPGNYTITVFVQDSAGNVVQKELDIKVLAIEEEVTQTDESGDEMLLIVISGAVIGIVLILIAAVLIVVVVKRKQANEAAVHAHQASIQARPGQQRPGLTNDMRSGGLGPGQRDPSLPAPPRPPGPPHP